MNILEIDKKIVDIIDANIEEIREKLKIDFEVKFKGLHGELLEKKESDKISIFIQININLYKSGEKYQHYGFDLETDFYDGEVYAQRNIEKDLNERRLTYNGVPIIFSVSPDELSNLFKKENILELSNLIYDNLSTNISILKKELLVSKTPNIFNNTEIKNKFSELAAAQRNLPEEQMLITQKVMSTGILSHHIEHIGDLTHRMSQRLYVENNSPESALTDITSKINNALRSLTSRYGLKYNELGTSVENNHIENCYGFQKEFMENMQDNYEYKYNNESDFKEKYPIYEKFESKVFFELNKYSDLHSQLPVYNEPLYNAREAAIALGRKDFKKALIHIKFLKELIEDPIRYIKEISVYDANYERNLTLNKSKKVKPH